ncbi:MAG: hypothetical protein KF773_26750 [Deltaproteobacteria bacterium]|nr:hypothetical protein [Deltaproteobacteria bacterium]
MSATAVACSNGDGDPLPIDAPTNPGVDAPTNPAVDAPQANVCTGALYDGCTGNDKCMSNNCRLFNGANLMVCTQTCDAANPCPAQNGQPVSCNGMGICRPQAANACTPQ